MIDQPDSKSAVTFSKIYSAIPKVMAKIGAISKDRKNTFQNYTFRGIEDLYNAIQPAQIEFGIFCCPQVLEMQTSEFQTKDGKTQFRVILKVCHKFYAEDGSHVDVITVGEGIDLSDKACNKAMSSAMKYAFIELYSIPTESAEDSDRGSPEVGRPKPLAIPSVARPGEAERVYLTKLAAERGWTINDVMIYLGDVFGSTKLSEITMENYQAMVAVIKSTTPSQAMAEVREYQRRGK